MGETTAIQWTDHTFNPWIGCAKVSQGCKHCYAETLMGTRYGRVQWGSAGERVKTSAANWRKPPAWFRKAVAAGERRRVFCASLADVFEGKADQEHEMEQWRRELWNLIEYTAGDANGGLDWLLLTKRPENVPYIIRGQWSLDGYPHNLWIGTSVESQTTADERIPHLLAIPAVVRFLSVEPLLEPVDLWSARYAHPGVGRVSAFAWGDGVDWVIVGGESGPEARPVHPQWVRRLRDESVAAEVPFFFKQWGEYGATGVDMNTGAPAHYMFETFQQWVNKASSRIRSGDICLDMTGRVLRTGTDFETAVFPVAVMRRVGKKRAGRLLDGREWNETPSSVRGISAKEMADTFGAALVAGLRSGLAAGSGGKNND